MYIYMYIHDITTILNLDIMLSTRTCSCNDSPKISLHSRISTFYIINHSTRTKKIYPEYQHCHNTNKKLKTTKIIVCRLAAQEHHQAVSGKNPEMVITAHESPSGS